jgi:signal transduction histidine kinase
LIEGKTGLQRPTGQARPGMFTRLYHRAGERYLLVLFAATALAFPPLVLMLALVAIPIVGIDLHEYLSKMLPLLPLSLVIGICAEAARARVLSPLRAWLHGGRGKSGAAEAWHAAVIGQLRASLSAITVTVVLLAPLAAWFSHEVSFNGVETLVASALATLFVLGAGAFVYLLWERALRPIVLEIGTELPSDFHPQGRALSLSSRLLILIPISNAITALVASAALTGDLSPAARTGLIVAVAIGVTAFIALPLTLLLRRSLVRPIGELLAAMSKVEAGGLDTTLPLTSADELGVVTEHFNSMLIGLRERETLREERLGLVEELRASRARIVASSDQARRKVERDLHDGAQQHLVLLDLKLGLLERKLRDDPEARAGAAEARADLERALAELRDLAHGIYPSVLSNDGLPPALEEAASRAAIPTTVESDGTGRYSPELEAAVYFCCLEALQNAGKYAGEGAKATISLGAEDQELRFEVRDDGQGFDPSSANGSAGLQNMADRIGALGGELSVDSGPGEGTRVLGSVPIGD